MRIMNRALIAAMVVVSVLGTGTAGATRDPYPSAPRAVREATDSGSSHAALRYVVSDIINRGVSGSCINVDGGGGVWGANLSQDCGMNATNWKIHDLGNQYVRFEVYDPLGMCLGLNPGTGVVGTWNCDDTTSVWWVDHRIEVGYPKLWNQYAEDRWRAQCLDVPTGDQPYLHLNPCNDGHYQEWRFWDPTP